MPFNCRFLINSALGDSKAVVTDEKEEKKKKHKRPFSREAVEGLLP